MKTMVILLQIVLLAFAAVAQAKKKNEGIVKANPNQVFKIRKSFEVSKAYPFGRANPDAPPETKQFEFMIGEFDCRDRILNPQNNKWFEFSAFRRAAYILNGYAIQDQNWTPLLNSTNIRSYNPKTKQWEVSYFKYPNYYAGVWKGAMEGENMVLRQGATSRLSFFNISKDQYSWKSERIVEGKPVKNWEFTCKRRR